MKYKTFVYLFFLLIVLFSTFEIAVFPFQEIFIVLRVFLFIFCVFLILFDFEINKRFLTFLTFLVLPSIAGLIFLIIGILFKQNVISDYGNYSFIVGRFFNIFCYFVIFTGLYSDLCRNIDKILKVYYGSIFILLLTVIYHSFSMRYSFLPFPFETRTNLHGLESGYSDNILRATGISREPSFLGSFLVEFFILTLFFIQKHLIKVFSFSLISCVMFFTFSPSVVLGLICSVILYLFLTIKFFNVKYVIFTFFLILFVFVFIYYFRDLFIFDYVYSRVLNVGDSSRGASINNTIDIMLNHSSLYNFLFGYGPNTYQFLDYSFLRKDYYHNFTVTSNNLYIDYFFEYGVLGIFIIIVFFYYLGFLIFNSNVSIYQKKFLIFLFCSLLVSNMYRGDYASFHFFFILSIVFIGTRVDFLRSKFGD